MKRLSSMLFTDANWFSEPKRFGYVLRYVRYDKDRTCGNGTGVGDRLSSRSFKRLLFSAAVFAVQGNSFSLSDGKGHRRTDCIAIIAGGHFRETDKSILMTGKRMEL